MRFTTRLRTAPGIWLAPLIAVVFIMVDQNASSGSYWLPLVVGDTARVMVANGLCAFAGALEGRRLKTVALTSNRVRAWWRILLGPVVASASVTTVLTVIFVARHGFASHPLGWAVLGVTLLSVWSWTIAGGRVGAVVARGRGGAIGFGGARGVDDLPAWDVDLLATSSHRHVAQLLHHHADAESGRHHGNLGCSAWSSGRGRDRCVGSGGTARTSVVSLLGSLGSQHGVRRRCRPSRAP